VQSPRGSAPAPAPAAADDDAIHAALARGDRTLALTRLMQVHGAELHRFCCSMLGDVTLADDVHQAVFVQAFEGLGGFRGDSSFRAWLFGIARHRCLDAARARRRSRWRFVLGRDRDDDPASHDEAQDTVADAIRAVEHTRETDRRSDALRACLRGLAPHVRVAVLLRYEQGLPYEEIARLSRERAAAIQMRVARALPVLRDCVLGKGVTL
jgi:RNA polymerase sigma-70 factor (ECF subfamily)